MTKEANEAAVNSFNSNHKSYDQLRPNFEKPIVDKFLKDLRLIENGEVQTEKTILELAAGTGKFTRHLVNYGWTKNLVIVEPSEGMLESFSNNFPNVDARKGSSYSIPLSDDSVDSIVIAQGFHWFADEASLKEMKRVLKPSGSFGCIWNFDGTSNPQHLVGVDSKPNVDYLFDDDLKPSIDLDDPFEVSKAVMHSHAWNKHVTDYLYSFDVNVPQYRQGAWKPLLMDNQFFKPIQLETFYYRISTLAQDSVYKYWLTRSYITNLPDEEKLKVEQQINSILKQYVTDDDKIIKDDQKTYLKRVMGSHTVVTEPV